MLICPAVAVNRQLTIPAEPMVVETINGPKMIDPPFLHSKPKIIHARLLSHSRREGQVRSDFNSLSLYIHTYILYLYMYVYKLCTINQIY